jgi:hypothetical protein
MAEGDLITIPFQYEFNSLLLGSLTPRVVTNVSGLLGSPSVEDRNTGRQDSHGAWPGPAYVGAREVAFDVAAAMESATAAYAQLALIETAFAIDGEHHKFVFSKPGLPTRYLNARTHRREFESSYDLAHGCLEGSVSLIAADPRAYGMILHEEDITIANGGTNNQAVVNNAGNAKAGATLEIVGPASNPIITNLTDANKSIKLTMEADADDIITIDVAHRAVLLNGIDAYGTVRADSNWWHLRPGNNTIQYTRSVGAAQSTLTITHRDTWI